MRFTREEIYAIVFLLSAVVLGAAVKQYRHRGELPPPRQAAHTR